MQYEASNDTKRKNIQWKYLVDSESNKSCKKNKKKKKKKWRER